RRHGGTRGGSGGDACRGRDHRDPRRAVVRAAVLAGGGEQAGRSGGRPPAPGAGWRRGREITITVRRGCRRRGGRPAGDPTPAACPAMTPRCIGRGSRHGPFGNLSSLFSTIPADCGERRVASSVYAATFEVGTADGSN